MKEKQVFTRKPYTGFLYKWSPETNIIKKMTHYTTGLPTGCKAKPFSQGEDYQTTYVYDFQIINGEEHRFAYVECGYVQ
jgi:hypothetical protein